MTQRIEITTPVGRLVEGSLHIANTKDMEGKPLIDKTTGAPNPHYYFALAIQKNGEAHWNQTAWGAKIHAYALQAYPQGQTNRPDFAWKISDGDSLVPNSKQKIPAHTEGFPGNWIIRFKTKFALTIVYADTLALITTDNFINLGDYIQVHALVFANNSPLTPGLYMNPDAAAFVGYGKRIIKGVDVKNVGFGQAPIPAEASKTPYATEFETHLPQPAVTTIGYSAPVVPVTSPPPYPEILNVPPEVPRPSRYMTAKANGSTYEQMIAAGWTNELLIQHGMIET